MAKTRISLKQLQRLSTLVFASAFQTRKDYNSPPRPMLEIINTIQKCLYYVKYIGKNSIEPQSASWLGGCATVKAR